MYSDGVKKLVEENWDKLPFMFMARNDPSFRQRIEGETKFMDEIYPSIQLRHRAYFIKHNITKDNVPKCKRCNVNPCGLHIQNAIKGLRTYCGPECSRADKTVSKDALKYLEDKDWLYDQRVNKRIAIETIGDNLGVSHVTVDKYLKIHKIRDVIDSTRKLEPHKKVLLKNKNFMYDLYVTQDKTLREIGEIIGCAHTCVKEHLNEHGIEIKPSNAYDRKFNKTSNEEKQIFSFIESVSSKFVKANDRKTLNGKEIDAFIPDLNLGIEYHGIYSHVYRPHESKECLIKGPDYHLSKTLACKSKGVRLVQFYSNEWNDSNEISKDIIKRKLLKNKIINIINCQIRIIDNEEAVSFLEKNKLNPSKKVLLSLGVYYRDGLVYVMTFYRNKHGWVISNNTPILGYSFLGATKKLINHFRSTNKEPIFVKVDRRFSEGTLYSSLGFTLYKVLEPKYYYTNNSYTKLYDAKSLEEEARATNQEEVYFLRKNPKYRKIYDCGSLIFKLE